MTVQDPREAELVADTRDSEKRLGFRNVASAERRLLFRSGQTYIELRVPPTAGERSDGGWLYGQFIVPDDVDEPLEQPIYAVLNGSEGATGAVRTTDTGEFAVPFRGQGEFVLNIEPAAGPAVRARFQQ